MVYKQCMLHVLICCRSENLKKRYFDKEECERLYLRYLDHEEERLTRKRKIRKLYSYEEFCDEVLGTCYVVDKNELVANEDGKKVTECVVADPFNGNVLPLADKGRKHDVRLKEPSNECTRSVDAKTDKGKRIGSDVHSHISISFDTPIDFSYFLCNGKEEARILKKGKAKLTEERIYVCGKGKVKEGML